MQFYQIFPERLRHLLRMNKIFSHIHFLRPLMSSSLLIQYRKSYHSFQEGLNSWFVNDVERRILNIAALKNRTV